MAFVVKGICMSPAAVRYRNKIEAGELSGRVPQPRPQAGAETGGLLCPEKMAAERWIALGLFVISCLYLCIFRRFTAMDPDEGIILQGVQRILHGQVLYRDFFSFFTPGSYYFLAVVFRVFGSSMLVARTVLAVYGGFFSVFTYLMARRACSRWSALMTTSLVIITCLPWRFMALHNWDSTLWACFTIYCAVRWLEASSSVKSIYHRGHKETQRSPSAWKWAFATGSLLAITVLFEQSKGAGLILGLGLGFAILVLLDLRSVQFSRGCAVALGAGLAWPFVITFGYFGLHHALPALCADWAWPLHHYTRVNNVPYGSQDWSSQSRERLFRSGPLTVRVITLLTVSPCFLIPVLPIIAIVLLVHWSLAAKRGALAHDRAAYYILVCCGMAGLLLSVIVVRGNIIHFVYLIPIFYLVLAWLIDGADIHSGLVSSIRPVATVCLCIAFTALGLAFLVRNGTGRWRIETRRGVVIAPAPDTVVSYTQAHVPAGSKMLVYPYLPLYYYLTVTYSPTRYEYLQPGMHTRKQDQEAIREIAADQTPVVLFEPDFNEKIAASWPNTPLTFIANDPVGDYILRHYHSCAILRSPEKWPFLFMVRKGHECPAG